MHQYFLFFLIFSIFSNGFCFTIKSGSIDGSRTECDSIECSEEEKEERKESVCGSNGSFYDSICELKLASCLNGINVTLENTVQKCSQKNETKKAEEKRVNSEGKRNDEDEEKKEDEDRKDRDVDGKKDVDRKDEEEDGEKKEENCRTVCLGIQDPVCGSDGTIYPNVCLMKKRNCGLKKVERMDMKFCFARARQGRRISDDACAIQCLETYRPVCGSDGVLYQNTCYLKRDTCRSKEKVVPVPRSLCIKTPRCPRDCLPIHDPTCGSDGKVYLNACQMKSFNCYGKPVTQMNISFCLPDAN